MIKFNNSQTLYQSGQGASTYPLMSNYKFNLFSYNILIDLIIEKVHTRDTFILVYSLIKQILF